MFCIIFITILGLTRGLIDERLTINRIGYGVMYDRVSEIVDSAGVVYFSHTWSIIKPDYPIPRIKEIDCTGLNDEITKLCASVNDLIAAANIDSYELITAAKLRLQVSLDMIEETTIEQLLSDETTPTTTTTTTATTPSSGMGNGRRRRAAGDNPNNFTVPELPENLDPDVDDGSDWDILIPGRLAGGLFTSIFDMPGAGAMKNTKRNLKAMGGAIHYNSASIIHLTDQLASIMQLTDKRLDQIQRMGDILIGKINKTRENMIALQDEFIEKYQNLSSRLFLLNRFKSMIVSAVYPQLFRLTILSRDIETLTDMWTYGFINLASGYLSNTLVSEQMIQDVITHITHNILTKPLYSRFNLYSAKPAFYYKTSKLMTYARTSDKLFITINMPMYRVDGKLPLYRIYSFPVPLTAGLEGEEALGFTNVVNLPAFIAVDKTTESYIEITNAQYIACTGEIKGVDSCGNAIGVTKRRNVEDMTCSFAIFIDDKTAITKFCDIAYDKTPPKGSARQLASDNSFLISSGSATEDWTINCPKSRTNPITTVQACNMCRMELSCGCSLTATEFKVNTRISGCETEITGVPKTTKIYTRNMEMLKSFVTEDDLRNVNSYTQQIDTLYPTVKIPQMKFKVIDNVSEYAEVSNKYGTDFVKGAELIKKNLTVYSKKVDEGLEKARDFSDQEVDREGSIFNALKGFLIDIFGGEFWVIISVVFSPAILALAAFGFALLTFIPHVKRDKRSANIEEQLELLVNEEELEDDRGNKYTYKMPLRATTFVDVNVLEHYNDKTKTFYYTSK